MAVADVGIRAPVVVDAGAGRGPGFGKAVRMVAQSLRKKLMVLMIRCIGDERVVAERKCMRRKEIE